MVDASAQPFEFCRIFHLIVYAAAFRDSPAQRAELRRAFGSKIQAAYLCAVVPFDSFYRFKTAHGKFVVLFVFHGDKHTRHAELRPANGVPAVLRGTGKNSGKYFYAASGFT